MNHLLDSLQAGEDLCLGSGEAESHRVVPALGVEVDPGGERDAGLREQVEGEAHRVVGEVLDVGIDIESAVSGRQLVHAHAAQSVEQERSEEHTSELQSLMRISYAV